MPLRPPLGSAGRPWLAHRLALAGRGADLLEFKRRALADEEQALAARCRETQTEWESAAREADRWLVRAGLISGERARHAAVAHVAPEASVRLEWRSWAGVMRPTSGDLTISESADLSALQPSSALVEAARAHKRALNAALEHAIAAAALRRVARELAGTVRRLRAIEKRWIPLLETALASLELSLDEADREDAVRARWVLEHYRLPWERQASSTAAEAASPTTERHSPSS